MMVTILVRNIIMWTAKSTEESDKVTKYQLIENDRLLNFREVIDLIQNSLSFRQFYSNVLRESPYEGYFWEVKSVTTNQLDETFEFVLINGRSFARLEPQKSFFRKYFDTNESIVAFPNLSGDAQLIVPTDIGDDEVYTHLAKFIRNAPEEQVEQFWQVVATQYEALIGDAPRWLSTHGLGVYWLHVRVDTRPKYYQYQAYR